MNSEADNRLDQSPLWALYEVESTKAFTENTVNFRRIIHCFFSVQMRFVTL